VARVVDAVLPHMRAQRAGRIVNVSSLAGLIPLPFLGAYCASKHALDSYSESLYHELLPLNIAVSIVAPGHFDTGIAGRKARPATVIPGYDPARSRMYDTIARDEAHAGPPDAVVRLLAALVEGRRRGLRHVIGPDAMMHRVRGLLPDGLWARGMRLALRID
jgi:short-subunit dehydrogenase